MERVKVLDSVDSIRKVLEALSEIKKQKHHNSEVMTIYSGEKTRQDFRDLRCK